MNVQSKPIAVTLSICLIIMALIRIVLFFVYVDPIHAWRDLLSLVIAAAIIATWDREVQHGT